MLSSVSGTAIRWSFLPDRTGEARCARAKARVRGKRAQFGFIRIAQAGSGNRVPANWAGGEPGVVFGYRVEHRLASERRAPVPRGQAPNPAPGDVQGWAEPPNSRRLPR